MLDRLARTARAAVDAAAREGLRPIGVSVAVPGLVEEASGTVVFAPNLGWENVRVGVELASRLELPVHVENESNLAALAEHWIGAAAGIDDFVCVFGEVGVGGGVVLGGRLFRGSHGFGGEFGHVSVDPTGLRCACGSRGCVETLVGEEAIARAAGVSPSTGRSRSLTDEIVRRAESGTPRVLEALADTGRWLGIALASTFNVLDVRAVVLGYASGRSLPGSSPTSGGRSRSAHSRPCPAPSRCSRRRSATVPPCAAPRRSRSTGYSISLGLFPALVGATARAGVRSRRERRGAGGRWRSVVASGTRFV